MKPLVLFWNLKKNLIRIEPEIQKQKMKLNSSLKTSVWVCKTRLYARFEKIWFQFYFSRIRILCTVVGSSKEGGETRQHIVVDYRAEALPTPPYHGLLHHISSLLAVPHTDTNYSNFESEIIFNCLKKECADLSRQWWRKSSDSSISKFCCTIH